MFVRIAVTTHREQREAMTPKIDFITEEKIDQGYYKDTMYLTSTHKYKEKIKMLVQHNVMICRNN
jgi:hypothetical protein